MGSPEIVLSWRNYRLIGNCKKCTGRSHVLLVRFLPIVHILTDCTSIMTKKWTFLQSPQLKQIPPVLHKFLLYVCIQHVRRVTWPSSGEILLWSRSCQFWWVPIHEFFLWWSIIIMSRLKIHLAPGPANFLLCFLIKFYSLTFQPVINFELIFT